MIEKPEQRFAGQLAVVTGACSDIGRGICLQLADAGARLLLADLDREKLADFEEEFVGLGVEVHSQSGDLSSQEVVAALMEKAQSLGGVDILVNNAGGGIIRPFLEHTPETLVTTVNRNLWTTLWCCWYALGQMKKKQYGRIVNIGADSVRNGLASHAAYNAAKGGVHGLTTGLAREFAKDKITVNTVAPCAVQTAILDQFLAEHPETAEKFLSVIPMGRAAEVGEVASMVTFLCSAEAAFVTGQVISVNGGSTML